MKKQEFKYTGAQSAHMQNIWGTGRLYQQKAW